MLVCVFVCLFSIEIQTVGRIGTGMVLEGEGSWGIFDPVSPHPQVQGAKRWSRVRKGGPGE